MIEKYCGMWHINLTTIILLSGITMLWTLSIEPNHGTCHNSPGKYFYKDIAEETRVNFSWITRKTTAINKPCIIGDAWAEECKSCICIEPRITVCRPTFCASSLTRALDTCVEGQTTKVACNTCVCRKNKLTCTKKLCPKVTH